jgi:hypothetical protein
MAWHDDPWNPDGAHSQEVACAARAAHHRHLDQQSRLAARRSRDDSDDGDACDDTDSIGGTGRSAKRPGMYIGDTAMAAACITSSRCSS